MESVVAPMKKPNTIEAWKLLLLSLPKGIASFTFAVAGLTVGITLSALVIGLPLLALVLIMCRRMLENENRLVTGWLHGEKLAKLEADGTSAPASVGKGWRSLLAVFASPRAYRGIFYCISQLAAGITFFTLSIVLPVTAFGVMLSPAAYLISERWFEFDLFDNGWLMQQIIPSLALTSYQQSWIAGGIGALLTLVMPMILRTLGRFYATWIQGIAGPEPAAAAQYVQHHPLQLQPLQQPPQPASPSQPEEQAASLLERIERAEAGFDHRLSAEPGRL